ncbi:MAG: tripartite tricarboxylate transporter TctB family protein, partial [Alphaproteobacteria bacterium]|nr:tripartite tricarboxylate transporter TctB family protein [Alphaproteobacteria bacterium]
MKQLNQIRAEAMGKLSRAHLVETGIWIFIFALFFAYSFEFNKEIEIYKFGATGWPRSILFLLILVGMGNLYYAWNNGSETQRGRVGFSEEGSEVSYNSVGQVFKTAFILLLPL